LLIIGLTGGVASGKSTVSRILKSLGAEIIDVDTIGREIVHKGSPCLEEIVRHFGRGILLEDGSLNRKKLGSIVFADRDELQYLNSIMHPVMTDRVKLLLEEMKRQPKTDKVVIDAAILIEMGLHRLVDEVWVVNIPKELQMERLMKRDGISRERAEAMVDAQMPMEQKREYADVIIENTGTIEELEKRVKKLWMKL